VDLRWIGEAQPEMNGRSNPQEHIRPDTSPCLRDVGDDTVGYSHSVVVSDGDRGRTRRFDSWRASVGLRHLPLLLLTLVVTKAPIA
jgi:hypothetical protein